MMSYISLLFIIIGCIFVVVGSIGIIRLSNSLMRMQSSSVIETGGTLFLFLGLFLSEPSWASSKILLLGALILFVSPLSSHISAYFSNKNNN